jgi:hypothetical protein
VGARVGQTKVNNYPPHAEALQLDCLGVWVADIPHIDMRLYRLDFVFDYSLKKMLSQLSRLGMNKRVEINSRVCIDYTRAPSRVLDFLVPTLLHNM